MSHPVLLTRRLPAPVLQRLRDYTEAHSPDSISP